MYITNRDPEFIEVVTILYREELGREPDSEGLEVHVDAARRGLTGEQIREALHNSIEGIEHRKQPPPAVLPALRVSGRDFVNAAGERVVLNGASAFKLYRQFLDGEDLNGLFQQWRELDFNMLRVFLTGSAKQNNFLDLRPTDAGYYERLREFAELVNSKGFVLLACAYVDAQDVQPGNDHWVRVAECLRGTTTLLSGGNEWSKNGFNPGSLVDPGLLWSRGSNVGDVAPYQPYASFAEFHPRRDLPAALMDTVASACFIYKTLNAPLIIDEPPRMGTEGSGGDYTNPFVCWKFARHYSTECAGAVFHSRQGGFGKLLDELTSQCARAWSNGMKV